jgi:hypothetical protein
VAELASTPTAADAVDTAVITARQARATAGLPDWNRELWDAEQAAQSDLVRDLFGLLPFRPVAVPASLRAWNEGCVVKLATALYEERLLPSGQLDPQRLAVLADALEEAGGDAELAGHLRGPGTHYRGCWVVDLLTGRQ